MVRLLSQAGYGFGDLCETHDFGACDNLSEIVVIMRIDAIAAARGTKAL